MATAIERSAAVSAKTRIIRSHHRTIAYRTFGSGKPFILCNRFGGNLDTWDPAFLDGLASHFRLVIFDYSGLGRSTGNPSFDSRSLANDVMDLADALGLDEIIIAGWSLGGIAAQTVTALYSMRVTHTVLIGTGPPGRNEYPPDKLFFETWLRSTRGLPDAITLFFEPKSEESCDAAKQSHGRIARRTEDLDLPIPLALLDRLMQECAEELYPDTDELYEKLQVMKTPLLVLSGDHDIVFPVQNWYIRTWELPKMQLVVFPNAGHGVQHQFPAACVDAIATFVRTSR